MSGVLTIRGSDLQRLKDLCKTVGEAKEHKKHWDEDTGPCIWLVGDQGVYLMGNHVLPEGEKPEVIYFDGCNPDKDAFDDWWSYKRATFGGDDGADPIPLSDFQRVVDKCRHKLSVSFKGGTIGLESD